MDANQGGEIHGLKSVTWPQATMVVNSQISVAIYQNGVQELTLAFDTGGSAADKSATVVGIVEANGSTDYFEHYVYHTMGANKSPVQLAADTFFTRIGLETNVI